MLLPLRSLYESQGGPPAITGTAAVQAVTSASVDGELAFTGTSAEFVVGTSLADAKQTFSASGAGLAVATQTADGLLDLLGVTGTGTFQMVGVVVVAGTQAFSASALAQAVASFLGQAELDQYGEMVAAALGSALGDGTVGATWRPGRGAMGVRSRVRRPVDYGDALALSRASIGVLTALNE